MWSCITDLLSLLSDYQVPSLLLCFPFSFLVFCLLFSIYLTTVVDRVCLYLRYLGWICSKYQPIFQRLYWARVCKPFMKPRNWFPARRAGTTTLFDAPARQSRNRSLESISWNRFLGSLNFYKFGLCPHCVFPCFCPVRTSFGSETTAIYSLFSNISF
jgi:hypothetical protein